MEVEIIDSRETMIKDKSVTYDFIKFRHKYYIGYNLLKTFELYLLHKLDIQVTVFSDIYEAMRYYQIKM